MDEFEEVVEDCYIDDPDDYDISSYDVDFMVEQTEICSEIY